MKYLGIDYGTKKVGLALSDEAGTMGFPHAVVPNDEKLLETVGLLIQKEQVGAVVVGESKDFSGVDNAVAKEARMFAAQLSVPVHFEPEMLTTQEARRDVEGNRDAGAVVDASAAALILTSYLSKPKGKARISIDEFSKIEVKVGTVRTAERVPETDKLLRLTVDFGESAGPRQIVSGINAYVKEPEELIGRQLAFVTNLEPRTIKGLESNGMLFAVGEGDTFAFLTPSKDVPPGTAAH